MCIQRSISVYPHTRDGAKVKAKYEHHSCSQRVKIPVKVFTAEYSEYAITVRYNVTLMTRYRAFIYCRAKSLAHH